MFNLFFINICANSRKPLSLLDQLSNAYELEFCNKGTMSNIIFVNDLVAISIKESWL